MTGRSKVLILFLLAFVVPISCASSGPGAGKSRTEVVSSSEEVSLSDFPSCKKSDKKLAKELSERMEIPEIELSNECDLLEYPGFVVMYERASCEPKWVAYELKAGETTGAATRERGFYQDPQYDGPQADNDDYRRTGWTRGHMVPAGDMKWSREAMLTSFYFTNICPQSERLNNGAWNTLENRCREWAKKYGRVYIVCGPLFMDQAVKTIGQHKVKVPTHFFKAVLIPKDESFVCAGYIFTNDEAPAREIKTIDELEDITCLDFFPALPNRVENQIEATIDRQMFR